MDAFARGLKIAAKITEDGKFDALLKQRYCGWEEGVGARIERGEVGFEELEAYTLKHGEPAVQSGRQEMLENLLNEYL